MTSEPAGPTSTSIGTAVVTLPADTQILVTRDFNAPKHLVYQVFTTPELIKRWWAGRHGEVTLAEIDLRVGGAWRYVMIAGGGFEVGFHGEYLEIVPNERLMCTEIFEGLPEGVGEVAVDTYTFTENNGRTRLTLLTELPTKEGRDMVMNSGMEDGMQKGWDIVEEIAVSLG